MAPTPPKRAKRGVPESALQVKQRIQSGGLPELQGELASIGKLTGPDAMDRMDALGISYAGHTETGVLRMVLAHGLNLGVLEENCSKWTTKGVSYAVHQVLGLTPSPADIDTPTKAKAYLRRAIDTAPSTAKRLFGDGAKPAAPGDACDYDLLSPEIQRAITAMLANEKATPRSYPGTDHAWDEARASFPSLAEMESAAPAHSFTQRTAAAKIYRAWFLLATPSERVTAATGATNYHPSKIPTLVPFDRDDAAVRR